MNAATALPRPVTIEEAAPSPQQRQLVNELARARTRLAALARELRASENELESLKPQRKQHQLAVDACRALEKLAEMGGAEVFWGEGQSAQGVEHIRGVRTRIEQFDARIEQIETRAAELLKLLSSQADLVEAIEHALFEAQDEEERLKYEWEIEREISELPRKLIMPWTREGEDDRRFRRSAAIALLLALSFGLVLPYIPLPARLGADGAVEPDRVVRLLMEERPEPPAPPKEEPKPKTPEQVAEAPPQKPAPQRIAKVDNKIEPAVPETPAKQEGLLAFRSRLSAVKDDQVVARLGNQARIDTSDYNASARAERSMLTTSAPGSSGGINLSSLSRGTGGGNGAGGNMAGVQVTRATSAIASVGTPGGDRPLSGDGAAAGRTDEEIQIVFDRYKAALYRLYNKELRNDPTLKGQVVLRLTIEPDGTVSLCELKSTDMTAPELTAQVIERVKAFDFGAKAVPAVTILYPIDFLPAA
ncbi:MAG: AgmX/PglI C-terminal domain-containing protein [Pseudomonadota bacterium]|nr:AgmX/PglI C-terminal domain-containing protein [Pseudomonadota bacterium]